MIRRLPEPPGLPHNFVMGWGERIKSARLEAGLTQVQLGAAINSEQPTISEWERGKNEPNFETIIKIADATGTNPCWLAFGELMPDPISKLLKVYGKMDSKGRKWLEDTVDREIDRLGIGGQP